MKPNRSDEFYKALVNKDSDYEGTFWVGVKSTGIFCRPTCPARKPKRENCEFFDSTQQALLASYRPCQRCKPLLPPNQLSESLQHLIEAVENNPEKRWKESDFETLGIDSSTARRQFKKQFNMTFIEYARARRLGIAFKSIREGESIIQAQVSAGYESGSGFRDAFTKIMGAPPSHKDKHYSVLKATWLETPLAPMIAIVDEKKLYLLEFVDRRGLEREIERLRHKTRSAIIPGETTITHKIEQELQAYFQGKLKNFTTPIHLMGSPFQQTAWEALIKIPYGETRSYKQQAESIGRPKSFRAVANANGCNQLAIIIPCHRIINTDGGLGGYGGGVHRKKWLLEHEKKNKG